MLFSINGARLHHADNRFQIEESSLNGTIMLFHLKLSSSSECHVVDMLIKDGY
ncbi:hypothetical protein GGE65_004922 [Skermanella aerolata]|uniref:hypothetical protein n=1 Tax=Skermanella aerolata TaxID=393310 RepID=UPI003D248F4A